MLCMDVYFSDTLMCIHMYACEGVFLFAMRCVTKENICVVLFSLSKQYSKRDALNGESKCLKILFHFQLNGFKKYFIVQILHTILFVQFIIF